MTRRDSPRRLRRFVTGGLGVLAIASAVAACGPSAGQTAAPKTAEFALVAGKTPTNGTFNFNGYAKGALTITVPAGWKVVIHYANGSALRHSLSVIPFTGTQPDKSEPPVFAGASTHDLTDGIGPGREETITFVPGKPGKYEFFCGILGHAQAGMWDYLIVSPTAKAPSIQPSGAVAVTVK